MQFLLYSFLPICAYLLDSLFEIETPTNVAQAFLLRNRDQALILIIFLSIARNLQLHMIGICYFFIDLKLLVKLRCLNLLLLDVCFVLGDPSHNFLALDHMSHLATFLIRLVSLLLVLTFLTG